MSPLLHEGGMWVGDVVFSVSAGHAVDVSSGVQRFYQMLQHNSIKTTRRDCTKTHQVGHNRIYGPNK